MVTADQYGKHIKVNEWYLLQLEAVGVDVVAVVAVVPEPLTPAAAPAAILPVLGGGRCRSGLALEPGRQRGGDPVGTVLGYPGA